jgi:hypothetical protein
VFAGLGATASIYIAYDSKELVPAGVKVLPVPTFSSFLTVYAVTVGVPLLSIITSKVTAFTWLIASLTLIHPKIKWFQN